MKTLLQKPLLLMAVLCIPLWIAFGNFILAVSASILIAMLVGMLRTLRQLSRARRQADQKNDAQTPPSPPGPQP